MVKLCERKQNILGFLDLERSRFEESSRTYRLNCRRKEQQLGRLHDLLGDRGYIDMGIKTTVTVAEAIATHRRRRHRVDLLNQIEDELAKLKDLGRNDDQDVSLWRRSDGTFKPKFSSQDTWKQIRQEEHIQPWSKGVWFQHATPKFSFVVWLAAQNRLSTGDRMCSWNSGVISTCVFCRDPMESRDHLFFSCPYSSQVWDSLTRGLLQHRYSASFSVLLSMVSDATFSPTLQSILRYVFQASIHSIWGERNRRRHGELPNSPDHLIKAIDRVVRNRLSTVQVLGNSKLKDGLRTWFGIRP